MGKEIFEPIGVGGLSLKNRLVRSATWEGIAAPDGVQVHVAHFFFLSRFVSPAVNRRADEYGGSSENRARIVCEIVRGIREEAPGLHISAKVNSCDFTPGGLDESEALALCRLYADAGLDSIEVSGNGTSVAGVRAYVDWAEAQGYAHIYLGGHSLGANKVIRYLSQTHDARVERFILLSPANLTYMTSGTTDWEKDIVREYLATGRAEEMLPFALMGWAPCVARTAHQWLFEPTLNNAHTEPDGDFSQAEAVTHTGMLLVGTYDNFTRGDPAAFLENINAHMPTAAGNELVFIEGTGHTYQMKEQEVADVLLATVSRWRKGE